MSWIHFGVATTPLENVDHYRVSCPNHIHPEGETVLCTEGNTCVEINGALFTLSKGEMAYIAPYDVHRYIEQEGYCKILIFRGDVVPPFSAFAQTHIPQKRVFTLSRTVFDHVIGYPREKYDLIAAQGLMAPVVREVVQKCAFTDGKNQNYDVFHHAIAYITEHYAEPLTLESVARQVGCHPASLSRIFRQCSTSGFCTHVNQIRCRHAIILLERGANMTEAAFASGFGSVRNFNRVFKQISGESPSAFCRELCRETEAKSDENSR